MNRNEIFCVDCNKYYENINSFKEDHDNNLSYMIMKQKTKKEHKVFETKNTLKYISQLNNNLLLLNEELQKKDKIINDLTKRIELIENLNNDFFLECNILIKNGKNIIKNIGTCFLNFISRCIYFRIECKGDILNNEKNNFNIEIIFPFRNAQIKQCSIEKLIGCVLCQEIKNDSDGNDYRFFESYSSYVEQKNSTISIKLLKHYSTQGKFEQKKINVIINGILIFNSLCVYLNKPLILYNIDKKKFFCYENYNWKFIDDFNLENGLINENCLISLISEDNDDNNNSQLIYIKGKYKYLGNNNRSLMTNDKKEAQLNIIFHNKLYGLVEIINNDNYSLSSDENGDIFFDKNEKVFYLICNIDNYY